MANILLITNIYPMQNLKLYGGTDVCKYFVQEWKKNGHNVMVVYNYSTFTPILHSIAKKWNKMIGNYFPTVINSERFKKAFEYELEDIKVLLNPMFRVAPKLEFNNKTIKRSIDEIVTWLNQKHFIPDIIVGHFLQPNIQMLPLLGKHYNCKTAIIAHGKFNKKRDSHLLNLYHNKIDLWGYRSFSIRDSFESEYPHQTTKQFMCFSGVPQDFIESESWKKHTMNLPINIIFVGNLIKRKFPYITLKAFSNSVLKEEGSNLKFIGSGNELKRLKDFTSTQNLTDQVEFLGRIPREKVKSELQKCQIFIMISKDETFGLVYLEAMACGCIVIASKNEGMDGIIETGINGYLCEAGNERELTRILDEISKLNEYERQTIAKNAIKTASKMTDKNMAEDYLNSILQS